MPYIEFSAPYVSGPAASVSPTNPYQVNMITRVFGFLNGPGTNVINAVANPNSRPIFDQPAANRSVGQLHIMRGAVPTSFSELVSFASRSADVLITYSTTSSNNGDFVTDQPTYNSTVGGSTPYSIIVRSSGSVPATQTGTATWFWITARASTGATTFTEILYHQIYGTVGVQGSGSDFEISDTNIITGTSYVLNPLTLTLPRLITS